MGKLKLLNEEVQEVAMTKTKYLFPPLTRILQTMKTGSIYAAGAIVLFFTISSMAIATTLGTHDNQSYRAGEYYYNFKTYPSYNINPNFSYYSSYKQNSSPSATIQLCQYEQGWQSGQSGESGQYRQSGQVDHLGQSELQIYTNEQGDEVMRTVPNLNKNNGGQGNSYYISPQIYPMPHAYPPPHFRPGQKPSPRPKP